MVQSTAGQLCQDNYVRLTAGFKLGANFHTVRTENSHQSRTDGVTGPELNIHASTHVSRLFVLGVVLKREQPLQYVFFNSKTAEKKIIKTRLTWR